MKIDDKKLRVGVYGILIHDNQVLMIRTQSGSKLIYNFPGGKVENDEGLGEALKRECQEEISADVKVGELFYTTKNLYIHEDFPSIYMFSLYYTIEVDHMPQIQNGEWFPIEKLPLDEMLPIDREFATWFKKTYF